MIKVNINRRLWETDQEASVIDDKLTFRIDGIINEFDLSDLSDGEYEVKDCLLPYNPFQSIKKIGDEIQVSVFIDDPYNQEGFEIPFAGVETIISPVPTADNNLEMAKTAKYAEISGAYNKEFIGGHFYSETFKMDVDYRRDGTKNDLQNVEVLIEVMEDNGLTETEFKGYQEQKAFVTLIQIKAMRKEMLSYSTNLFGKKEALEAMVDMADSIEAVKEISW